MNAELEELKTILASEKQFSELAYASKYKELGSKKKSFTCGYINCYVFTSGKH